ncbi:MAG: DUF2500 family protein [Eubacteriales bacterium]|nr:DUF2500 family protein [Eubacteriales bacterium]
MNNSNNNLVNTQAKVAEKYKGVDRSPEVNGRSTAVRFFVTFSQANGENITLKVPYFKYLKLHEGDTGKLQYEGDSFVEFIVD